MTFWLWIAASLFVAACIAAVSRQVWLEMHPRSKYDEALARMRVQVVEFQRIIGAKLLPALHRATEGLVKFAEAYRSAQKETE